MHRSLLIVIVVFLAIPCSLKAQDTLFANLPKQWRLEDCIDYAKKNNISLATLRLTTRSTEEDLLQSKAGILPNLTGSVSQSIVNSNNANPVVGGFQTQANFSSSYGVNSSMTIYNNGYLKMISGQKNFQCNLPI